MSHAPIGQRSAQSPQCTQEFSSLTITFPVCGNVSDTKMSCTFFNAGVLRRDRSSTSGPFSVMVRQLTGQISMQASHSIQRFALNTVCISQFRQRSASLAACWASNPIPLLDSISRNVPSAAHGVPAGAWWDRSRCCNSTHGYPSWYCSGSWCGAIAL